MECKKIFLTWEEYFKLCNNLVEQMKDVGFTDIIAIARGGLIPAQYIAYKLNIKRIYTAGISSYKEKTQTDFVIYQGMDGIFDNNSKVLIIDDIADSGKTIQLLQEVYAFKLYFANIVKVCTLQYKPKKSVVTPNYYAQAVENNDWIVYPYDNN